MEMRISEWAEGVSMNNKSELSAVETHVTETYVFKSHTWLDFETTPDLHEKGLQRSLLWVSTETVAAKKYIPRVLRGGAPSRAVEPWTCGANPQTSCAKSFIDLFLSPTYSTTCWIALKS